MRALNAAVIILTSASFTAGFDEAALAGVPITAIVSPSAVDSNGSVEKIYWDHSCDCWRQRIGSRRRVARSSWMGRPPVWAGGCWRWRATHWGIGRVWSCW
jgi:hypothetical protein